MSSNANKALLIESDPQVANAIIAWLKGHIEVLVISNESETEIREKLQSQKWQLVMTDIDLPTFNDLNVTDLAKSTFPTTPVVILTQDKKVNFILNALQNHADGLLFKPLNKEKFLNLVLMILENAQVKQKKETKIILAIGAHPDDVEIGCGGSLAAYKARGNAINILTLSLGAAGGNPSARKNEAERAAQEQKATLYLGNLVDRNISAGHDTIDIISKIIQTVQPTHVYTHSAHDNHQDHRNVFHATLVACRSVLNLYCYQSPSSSIYFQPNLFIGIDPYIEKKLQALAIFESQHKVKPYLNPDLICATARYWGRFSNYGLVEPMEVIREGE